MRSATRSRRNCASPAPGTNRCSMARGSNWACAPFWKEAASRASRPRSRTLHGLRQLPGLAPQRLMAEGYGFAGEGDWKTAALVRAMKVMGEGLPGGTSFMEDYTYHLAPDGHQVLGAHMLEICPTIAADKPRLEIHPLSIGGKEDPVRLVFDARDRPGAQREPHRSRRPVPPAGQRSDRGRPPCLAETAGRPRGLGMQARLQDGVRRLDSGRRRASHGLQLQRDPGDARGFRHDRRHRDGGDRTGNQSCRASSRTCATTTSTITWRKGSAPEPERGDVQGTQA